MVAYSKRVHRATDLERFDAKWKLDPETGCWLWIASVKPNGYGNFRYAGKWRNAHRMGYTLYRETIPEGLDLDHLCRVRHCVNPAHLEPVTHQENMRRGVEARVEAEKLWQAQRRLNA